MEPRDVHESRDDIQIVDVRQPGEWRAGHIQDARHIPMGDLSERQDEIATDRKIVCVCRSGARSGQVADALGAAGYDAENMEGGMQAWAKEGLPFVDENGSPGQVV